MLLLNTRFSFAITSVDVAILMRISALHVPYLDKITPQLKFDTTSSSSPFMVTLTLMLFLLFSMIFGPFYVDSHAVCAATCNQWVCQVLQFVVALPIRSISCAKRRLQTSQSPIKMAVCCSLRVSCKIFSGKNWTEQERVNTPI